MLEHAFKDVAVADGADRRGSVLSIARWNPVRHHGGDDGVAGERAALLHLDRGRGEDLVAVDDSALGIGEHRAIGIAVVRHTRVSASSTTASATASGNSARSRH